MTGGFLLTSAISMCLVGGALMVASATANARQVHERDSKWTAPADAVQRKNPLSDRADATAGGRKLFHQRCATCHGHDARGTGKGPDLMSDAVQAQSDGALFWKISQGNTRGGMPTFSFLPEAQRWQLVLHLRTNRNSAASDVRYPLPLGPLGPTAVIEGKGRTPAPRGFLLHIRPGERPPITPDAEP